MTALRTPDQASAFLPSRTPRLTKSLRNLPTVRFPAFPTSLSTWVQSALSPFQHRMWALRLLIPPWQSQTSFLQGS